MRLRLDFIRIALSFYKRQTLLLPSSKTTFAVFRRTHRHRGAHRGRPSRFWTTARRATLAEIVAAENERTATAALMRPRPRLARGLCRSRVHRQLRTSPRVAGQLQREPLGTPRVPKRLYFHLNSIWQCQYGSFEWQLSPAGFSAIPIVLLLSTPLGPCGSSWACCPQASYFSGPNRPISVHLAFRISH